MWTDTVFNMTAISVLTMLGLSASNYLYDKKIPQYVSRKLGHIVGGLAYLLSMYLFTDFIYPVMLSVGFTLLLGGARLIHPSTFRGIGGSGRSHAFSELWFPLAGTFALLVGWGIFNDPLLAIIPILFMAWGDAVTGLIRSAVYKKEVKGNLGSLGMLVVCGVIALFYPHLWVSIPAAIIATAAEKWTPLSKGYWDDNWVIVITSLGTMILINMFGS